MRTRLHALCPYFAMFPPEFVEVHVMAHTAREDYVYDPFSGRGTTLLQSLLMERNAVASDINPVAYCISGAKSDVPDLQSVTQRLDDLKSSYAASDRIQFEDERSALPVFFGRAYYHSTLRQILFLRSFLDWGHDPTDRFISALALGSLHGEMDKSAFYFSNQMPRTISPKPAYSLRFWRARNLWPKKRDVFDILRHGSLLRLSATVPSRKGIVALQDARTAAAAFSSLRGRIKAVITSPPYFNVTRTEEDQWLRLWFLGHEAKPTYSARGRDDRHRAKDRYWKFLAEAWSGIAPLLQHNATLVCRIGAKGMDESEITKGLLDSVLSSMPNSRLVSGPVRTEIRKRQTESFRPGSTGCRFEVDHVFCLAT